MSLLFLICFLSFFGYGSFLLFLQKSVSIREIMSNTDMNILKNFNDRDGERLYAYYKIQ